MPAAVARSPFAHWARLLGRIEKPLNPVNGAVRAPPLLSSMRRVASAAPSVYACPVDAIVGAQRFMHTVAAELCTGCDLCLPPCPVDCIELRPALDVRGEPIQRL